jgi:hypothetical protein
MTSDNTALAVAIVITVATAILFLLGVLGPASAHDAPLGWSYGYECCSTTDCSQRPEGEVSAVTGGYRVNPTGEIIPYDDDRVRRSHDEYFHRCASNGDMAAKHSICLYVPDTSF